jgi:hypothetical protein
MNLIGFSVIHESNLKPGVTYYLRTKFGQGFVMASEDQGMKGWSVELQPDSSFQTPALKKLRSGSIMMVPPTTGKWYQPES